MKDERGHGREATVTYAVADDGCWNWQGLPGSHGYGQANRDGRITVAHRYVYERERGAIPESMHLHHRCENRSCVNPDHLEVVSASEHARITARNRREGGFKVTWADVRAIRASGESHAELGRRYGVTPQYIYRIRKRVAWPDAA